MAALKSSTLFQGEIFVRAIDFFFLFFFSLFSGFAFVHPNNTCSVNAVEAIPLADLDLEAAKAGLSKYEALSRDASTEEDKALAAIGLNVHQALVYALQ